MFFQRPAPQGRVSLCAKYKSPAGEAAISVTAPGVSVRTPGGGGVVSQTKVIFVLPLDPGDMPTHVRIRLRRAGMAASALVAPNSSAQIIRR